ncbi:hypothetical protein [Jeotgalibacillus sp. JSM ZJ347]|uniref:hypothetical protein n=1 Tax=Jeotgalibacillus sp. JSM ZJ347 TaxID=3342117 RepID=UPI0035A8E6ED
MSKFKKISATLLIAISLTVTFGSVHLESKTEKVNLSSNSNAFSPNVDRVILPPPA